MTCFISRVLSAKLTFSIVYKYVTWLWGWGLFPYSVISPMDSGWIFFTKAWFPRYIQSTHACSKQLKNGGSCNYFFNCKSSLMYLMLCTIWRLHVLCIVVRSTYFISLKHFTWHNFQLQFGLPSFLNLSLWRHGSTNYCVS